MNTRDGDGVGFRPEDRDFVECGLGWAEFLLRCLMVGRGIGVWDLWACGGVHRSSEVGAERGVNSWIVRIGKEVLEAVI